ncbi:MAG TPA: DUF2268 domain-containing putative Zn-dependent protease, partial [Blastocatellia bacterium]|nr:DUF2268 domain-containing putative Zn-dependent protease [Blastocatellia bacterium]
SPDPDAARLVTSDIANFWRAYDRATPDDDLIVFRNEYLRKGSYGLQQFLELRIGSVCNLVGTIEKHPKYYASIRESTLKVDSMKDAIRASFYKLKELYPEAVFPDVYFLIGRMNSAGTVTDKGLLIGAEMHGLTKQTPMEELGDWHKAVLKSIEAIPYIVAHELIHYQQKYPEAEATLLHRAVGEGSADFIAELISGKHINMHLHEYGNPREKELWAEFQKEMDGKDVSNWLYQGDKSKHRPADLGYYMGYKICESYYKQAADKKQAVRDILEIKAMKQFLTASKYVEKFEN